MAEKRPAADMSGVKVTITGSDYLAEHGVEAALQEVLEELEKNKPENPLQRLRDALASKRLKTCTPGSAEDPTAFPGPGAEIWRTLAKARSVAIEGDPAPGIASIVCNGEDRLFPVHPKDTALVVIDMQTDFLEPTGRVGQHYKDSPVRSGLDNCVKLLTACREAGLTIAHSRSHRYGSVVRSDLVGISDEGYELHPRMAALPGEIVVDKWTFGAFASTFLEQELRKRGVNRILLCGVLTNVCIFATASQAVDRFFRVCLVEDCCAAFTNEWHDMALKLINQPQTAGGHKRGIGLYFGEVTQVEKVESALKDAKKE